MSEELRFPSPRPGTMGLDSLWIEMHLLFAVGTSLTLLVGEKGEYGF